MQRNQACSSSCNLRYLPRTKGRKLVTCATMNRFSLALLIVFIASVAACGQSVARVNESPDPSRNTEMCNNQAPAACAIAMLRQLDREVLVYRSLREFEDDHRLARVSFQIFKSDLQEVTAQVEPLLAQIPPGKLRWEITNALDSYRDGVFWWQKIDQPRVVHVSALTSMEVTRTSSDAAFLSTVPYTVVVHWRQARTYLKRAEALIDGQRKLFQ